MSRNKRTHPIGFPLLSTLFQRHQFWPWTEDCLSWSWENLSKLHTEATPVAPCSSTKHPTRHKYNARDHSGIFTESRTAKRAPNCFLNLNNKQRNSANSKEIICTLDSMLGLSERKDFLAWSIESPTAFKVRWKVQPAHRAIVLCYQRAQKEKLLLSGENLSWTGIIPPERLFALFCIYCYCLLMFEWESIIVPWCTGADLSTSHIFSSHLNSYHILNQRSQETVIHKQILYAARQGYHTW